MSEIEYASFEDLTSADEVQDQVVVLRSGKAVMVRGLTRAEWFRIGKVADGEPNLFETEMIAVGLQQPKLSKKQVEAWRNLPGAYPDVGAVSDRIRDLTGITEGADKSDLRDVRSESE